jgi:hypothetical protein
MRRLARFGRQAAASIRRHPGRALLLLAIMAVLPLGFTPRGVTSQPDQPLNGPDVVIFLPLAGNPGALAGLDG